MMTSWQSGFPIGGEGNSQTTHTYILVECVFNTTATDAMILKHQARSSHSAEEILIALVQFYTKILHLQRTTLEKKIFWKK